MGLVVFTAMMLSLQSQTVARMGDTLGAQVAQSSWWSLGVMPQGHTDAASSLSRIAARLTATWV